MKRFFGILTVSMCTFISPIVFAGMEGSGQDESFKAYQNAYNLVLDEKWSEASSAFDTFLKQYPRSSHADAATFWSCFAKEKLGKTPEDVFKCYKTFAQQYPHSEFVDDANSNLIRLAKQCAKAGKP